MNTDRRNRVKNQNEGIHPTVRMTVTVTIRKEIEVGGALVVAIGLKGQRSLRSIKEEIRNVNDEKIKYHLNLPIEKNPKNIDLDHLVDDNV